MSPRTLTLDDRLYAYVTDTGGREPEVGRRLREKTAAMPMAGMQIAPDQGNALALLVELIGARRAVEVGTFTGYSALRTALALPEDGELVCCDVSDEWTSVGRPFWEEAGVAGRIDLRIAPATETLDGLIAGGWTGTVDFVFIDADKPNYDAYYERALVLVRTGGLIAVDNVLWNGAVVDDSDQSADTRAIRALNTKIHGDRRVTMALLPIGDGLTLARKR
ncbi:MAG: class I SAM-dependent methyltransferase [Thalassobaculum sp.]|uniref:class I SAM-dependent methyltransferase n=1 Tax=Thalassobaculum sp. TaxID=2022740 RepID=UPI0032F04ABA